MAGTLLMLLFAAAILFDNDGAGGPVNQAADAALLVAVWAACTGAALLGALLIATRARRLARARAATR